MPTKLNVLISAYACEPNKGSEPEVGWQWAMQMSQYHEVTVLTRENNRENIERELALLGASRPLPRFIYHDEGRFALWFKRRFKFGRLYYVLWQVSAWRVIERLKEEQTFDLLHHVTFAGFRYRTAIWNHGLATVWGPVGGVESIPWGLLPWRDLSSLFPEALRNINNFVQSAPFHVLPKRAQETTITLVSTEEMAEAFLRLGLETILMPTIGLNIGPLPPEPSRNPSEPLRLLFVGNVITLKGIDLAIEALKESGIDGTFTIVGDGKFLAAAKKLAVDMGVSKQVIFRGRISRAEVLKVYLDFDVFLFPSLHDSGGYAIIEAMVSGVPVICLDCGGPRVAVKDGAGVRVPLASRRRVVQNLAAAIREYDQDRDLVRAHGAVARDVILRDYDWQKKGRQLNRIYWQAMDEHARQTAPRKLSETGWMHFMRRFFPARGLAISVAILFMIGAAGFLSLGTLKQNARLIVGDTLPGLSDSGAANSSLGEAFNRTLMVLMAETPEERALYRRELDEFSGRTSKALMLYDRTGFSPGEQGIYQKLLERREQYTLVRKQVLALVDENKHEEALALCNGKLIPAYFEYKTAAENLLKFNVAEGRARGDTILKICTVSQCLVAGIAIVLFVVGFLVGLFR